MPFQYPNPGANLVNEYLASSIPFLTSSSFLSASSAIEISFPYVASFVNVYNSSPTGSLAVAFAAPGINTSAHFDVAPGTSESFPVRCTSVFLGASAGAAQSYSLAAGLTGIQVRDNNFYQYDPGDEGGLVGEWDARYATFSDIAATLPTSTMGSQIAVWGNLRGSNNLVQSTAVQQPIYNPNGLGTGKPALTFDGVNDGFGTASALGITVGTIFIIGKLETFANSKGFFKLDSVAGGTNTTGIIQYFISPTDIYLTDASSGGWSTRRQRSLAAGQVDLMTFYWGSVINSPDFRFNGVAPTFVSRTGATYNLNLASNKLFIGNTYAATFINASYSHILVYNQVLSLPAIQRVEAYLKSIWGIP